MNKVIQLKNTRLPRMLGDLTHSNQFLKLFALISIGITAIVVTALTIVVTKPPIVLTLSPSGTILEKTELPSPENEIKSAVKIYLENRYNWEPGNVAAKLKLTEGFILPPSIKAFQISIANIIHFSTEKQVSQKVYPNDLKINLNQKTVLITGDRITAIQGMKSAGNLRLELSFESGTRTKENPWGIYITKEREEQ
jgi:hypothetical protein